MNEYDKYEYHATAVPDMKKEFIDLQTSTQKINERLDILSEQLNTITSIQIINGGGIPVKATIADLLPRMYHKITELEKKIDNMAINDEKVLMFVKNNADKIIPIVDKRRKELDKENVEYSNIKNQNTINKMNIMWYIIFFISVIINIISFIYTFLK